MAIKAFPSAEGFGANSVGGRGGTVYEVTNTDDSGTGSLRTAVEASGARTVVFRTGGTITLTSRLQITNPYITIAGQTAPGGGICLKGSGTWDSPLLSVETHNVIIRYVRLRQGAMTDSCDSRDGILIGSATPGAVHDVVIDHCSISWSVDENVTIFYDPYNITVQWCIISEGLKSSTHESGDHSMGMVIGWDGARDISVHHNLFAHNNARNPYINISGTVDIVNNVLYNSGQETSTIGDLFARGVGNYVGNYDKRGGDSTEHYFLNIDTAQGEGYDVYLQGNITPENLRIPSGDLDYTTTTRK